MPSGINPISFFQLTEPQLINFDKFWNSLFLGADWVTIGPMLSSSNRNQISGIEGFDIGTLEAPLCG
ncbi:MAG: hypothetical protein CMM52_09785 [Rhodospirillaceae bacterium]|nr:hypothetical protein [Rhodospirillaceae bacterium]